MDLISSGAAIVDNAFLKQRIPHRKGFSSKLRCDDAVFPVEIHVRKIDPGYALVLIGAEDSLIVNGDKSLEVRPVLADLAGKLLQDLDSLGAADGEDDDVPKLGPMCPVEIGYIAQAVDQLVSRGARAYGISVRIMLPTFAYESRLKAMMVEISEICKEKGLRVFFADAQSVNGIQTSIVHVTAHGEAKKEQLLASRSAKAGEEIVLVKWIGMEGTLRIIREEGAALAERFAPGFLNKLEDMRDEIFSDRAMEIAGRNGVSAMHPIGEGGILAALWDMAEGAGIGLSVEMKKMTVRQETIEVCEVFHLNPYQLTSTGAVLMVTPKGEELKERLKREGIPAEIIGHTTEGNERIIWGGGEKRFLDRPAPDELARIYEMKENVNA